MAKLSNIYVEAGGEANLDVEAELLREKNITSFDSLKLILAKKMQLTREKIFERDQLMELDKSKKGKKQQPQNRTDLIEINNKIRTMLGFLKRDFDQLNTMHEKSRFFLYIILFFFPFDKKKKSQKSCHVMSFS